MNPLRQRGHVWTPITPKTGALFHADPHPEAPNDGKPYAWQSKSWVAITSSGGGTSPGTGDSVVRIPFGFAGAVPASADFLRAAVPRACVLPAYGEGQTLVASDFSGYSSTVAINVFRVLKGWGGVDADVDELLGQFLIAADHTVVFQRSVSLPTPSEDPHPIPAGSLLVFTTLDDQPLANGAWIAGELAFPAA